MYVFSSTMAIRYCIASMLIISALRSSDDVFDHWHYSGSVFVRHFRRVAAGNRRRRRDFCEELWPTGRRGTRSGVPARSESRSGWQGQGQWCTCPLGVTLRVTLSRSVVYLPARSHAPGDKVKVSGEWCTCPLGVTLRVTRSRSAVYLPARSHAPGDKVKVSASKGFRAPTGHL